MIRQISNRTRFFNNQILFKRFKFSLPDLPYDYNALEPVISAEIMQLHHQKHHAAYVSNLNVALEKLDRAMSSHDLSTQIALQSAIKFNGGGNLNHSIFWKNLCPPSKASGQPSGSLAATIDKVFGSFSDFKAVFKAQTAAVQGSGWGWLGYNPMTRSIQFATTFNQDPLHATHGLIPLMGVDVWEHAYYLQYKNARPDYLDAIWKIINWDEVALRFKEAESSHN